MLEEIFEAQVGEDDGAHKILNYVVIEERENCNKLSHQMNMHDFSNLFKLNGVNTATPSELVTT